MVQEVGIVSGIVVIVGVNVEEGLGFVRCS
jgi:hypothetical protein